MCLHSTWAWYRLPGAETCREIPNFFGFYLPRCSLWLDHTLVNHLFVFWGITPHAKTSWLLTGSWYRLRREEEADPLMHQSYAEAGPRQTRVSCAPRKPCIVWRSEPLQSVLEGKYMCHISRGYTELEHEPVQICSGRKIRSPVMNCLRLSVISSPDISIKK